MLAMICFRISEKTSQTKWLQVLLSAGFVCTLIRYVCFSGRQPMVDLVDKSKELRVLDAKAAQNFGTVA